MPARATAISFQDADLVEQVRDGDTAAFGQLVAKYQDRLYNTVWRICGHVDDARDLTQEAFLKALESLDGFGGKSSFYTWLFRIGVNVAISHQRQGRRRMTVSLEDGPERWQVNRQGVALAQSARRARVGHDDDPATGARQAETNEIVVAALGELDDDQRAVLVLRDIESLDYEHIADVLAVPVGTVKSRVHRARMALREKLRPRLGGTFED